MFRCKCVSGRELACCIVTSERVGWEPATYLRAGDRSCPCCRKLRRCEHGPATASAPDVPGSNATSNEAKVYRRLHKVRLSAAPKRTGCDSWCVSERGNRQSRRHAMHAM